ncbi:aminoglycoside phosphotransferase family protein [Adhaeribacter swui]|uniref:Aminoglycoside phosphotransferase family protein n=1 Tax=Adhaeribacter swui TaxID=2086471 RepID=A0A7G7G6S8_9BACT|nr:aminoglycoside phosphotransferase family protein [Adhaeribacter swui]QNF32862.1 aminoglycoside phosphotransferase family protein [Adhaeribacter swui]
MKKSSKEAYDLPDIIAQFKIQGTVGAIQTHGSGHIHDTFHVANHQAEAPDYLLQRINHHIFKNVPLLMDNIRQVTAHLREKLQTIPGAEPGKEVLTLVPTHHDQWYYQDEAGNYWRMYYFLKNTNSYDIVQTPQQAFEGGKAFGRFQALLADLAVDRVHDTIPNFHNIQSRLQIFRAAIQKDPVNRVKDVAPEIAFVEERAEAMSTILRLGEAGALPLRITHNDTKFNNVLLSQDNKAQCVIDLDTVMPGYVAYDFGDAIRTTVNTAAEDEKDLEKVTVNMALLESFTQGFLEETKLLLSKTEIESLALGVLLLPYIMGLRFLTDYIDGDNYYKIHFPEHNLQRARAQLQLVKKLEEQYPQIEQIIRTCAQVKPQLSTIAK